MLIPAARKALDAEWKKLETKTAWLLDTVQEYDTLAQQSRKDTRKLHFGGVMELCHIKHSELPPDKHQ